MRTITLLISVLFALASMAVAAESQGLSQEAADRVQQQTAEMSALGIPEAQAKKMLTLMVENHFEERNVVRAQEVVMDAAKSDLPCEPIMSKAVEGMAKQAGEQQIIAAMESVRSRYAHASRLAKSLSDDKTSVDALTHLMADSMAAGMRAEDLEAVKAQLATQSRTRQQTRNRTEDDQLTIQTLQTARTMARLGIRSADVSDTLCQALQSRYTYSEMEQLRHHMAQQVNRSSPQQVASRHANSIGKGGNPGNAGSGSGGSGGGSGGGGAGGNK